MQQILDKGTSNPAVASEKNREKEIKDAAYAISRSERIDQSSLLPEQKDFLAMFFRCLAYKKNASNTAEGFLLGNKAGASGYVAVGITGESLLFELQTSQSVPYTSTIKWRISDLLMLSSEGMEIEVTPSMDIREVFGLFTYEFDLFFKR